MPDDHVFDHAFAVLRQSLAKTSTMVSLMISLRDQTARLSGSLTSLLEETRDDMTRVLPWLSAVAIALLCSGAVAAWARGPATSTPPRLALTTEAGGTAAAVPAAGLTADPTPTPEPSPTASVVWREEIDTSPGQPIRPAKHARMEAASAFSGPTIYPTLAACQAAIAQLVERQRAMLARYPVMRGAPPMYSMHEDGYTQRASIGFKTVLETHVTWTCGPYTPPTTRRGAVLNPWNTQP